MKYTETIKDPPLMICSEIRVLSQLSALESKRAIKFYESYKISVTLLQIQQAPSVIEIRPTKNSYRTLIATRVLLEETVRVSTEILGNPPTYCSYLCPQQNVLRITQKTSAPYQSPFRQTFRSECKVHAI